MFKMASRSGAFAGMDKCLERRRLCTLISFQKQSLIFKSISIVQNSMVIMELVITAIHSNGISSATNTSVYSDTGTARTATGA